MIFIESHGPLTKEGCTKMLINWQNIVEKISLTATQTELGDAIGVSHTTIGRWGKGRCSPQPRHRKSILKYCEENEFTDLTKEIQSLLAEIENEKSFFKVETSGGSSRHVFIILAGEPPSIGDELIVHESGIKSRVTKTPKKISISALEKGVCMHSLYDY